MDIVKTSLNRLGIVVFLVLFFSLFFSFFGFSQFYKTYSIGWEDPLFMTKNGIQFYLPKIKDQGYIINVPVFELKEKTDLSIETTLVYSDVLTEVASDKEQEYIQTFLMDSISDSVSCDVKVVNGGGERYISISLFPFVLKNGVINKIKSFSISQTSVSPINKFKTLKSSFVNSSVLASGQWFKISLNKDGVYKIDKSFLEKCGIDTKQINPMDIHIFGNGEGRLPELNSVYRTDDLAQNAIIIVGGEDGKFDDSDYILFYGWGPNRWRENSGKFYSDRNIYSDVAYYFLTVNSNLNPLEVEEWHNEDLQTVTYETNSYSYFDIHEEDNFSLVGGGQRWYGELFDVNLEQQYKFDIPNIDSSNPIIFDVAIASNAGSSSGTNLSFLISENILSSSSLPVGDYSRKTISFNYNNPINSIALDVKVMRNSPKVLTYLDYILLNARRGLIFNNSQFNFRDLKSVGLNQFSRFKIGSSSNDLMIWDVSDKRVPKLIKTSVVNGLFQFDIQTTELKEFVAFNLNSVLVPSFVEKLKNQNLHALDQADYLIVTHQNFSVQANRLADLHRQSGLKVHVVNTAEVFNEFSCGSPDPTAIRDFVRMFYKRSMTNNSLQPKYLLLFGDGTYDPKNRIPNNNNYVPTYQALNSEYFLSAMVIDDYFGMLDDNESIKSTDMLDIGVGRLLISDLSTAKQQVDKIEHYMKNGSNLFKSEINLTNSNGISNVFGDWRNRYVIIADDEENGYFLKQDAEPNFNQVVKNFPEMNCEKLYLDAFKQISNAGGQRYPDVENLITKGVQKGALIVNYIGHGGESGAAEERVITIPQIQSWTNIDKLNLFVSATCEFTKFDDPSRLSAGEWLALNPVGGSIALMTTTRSVFFGVNTITGLKFYENVFSRDLNGLPLRFGDIIMRTKNETGSSDNKRSFTLIGDPALRIALPVYKIITDSINGFSVDQKIDTLKALSKVVVKGRLVDLNGDDLNSFQGVIQPTVFDKIKIQNTLGQDPDSPILPFKTQKNALYRGNASVKDGKFEFSFIVPKDINYTFGPGKLSYYANSMSIDANGVDTNFIVGGIDTSIVLDSDGPEIDLFLDNENFVNGGLTNESPVLIVKLFDQSGINTVGNGIGHDITLVIDEKTASPIILNEYYVADLDSYQTGTINYIIDKLNPGKHTLRFKVWDVNNNSSDIIIDFIVHESQELALKNVLNYPNPFTTNTDFYFEHNQVNSFLDVQVKIFTISGKLVKTIQEKVLATGFRNDGISWDGLDDYGDQIAKGVYLYKISVKTQDGKLAEKVEKLVILR